MEEEAECKKLCNSRRGGVKGGLIVRKMNGYRGTGDTSIQTLMDSVPAGGNSYIHYKALT